MPTLGNSTVTLSNPSIAFHSMPDGNVVTAYRSDNGALININVQEAESNEDILAILNAVALQLAQQDAVGSALVQMVLIGTATSVNGTSTVNLHPYSYVANNDGLTASYTLSNAPNTQTNVNLGTCSGPDQSALDTFAAACVLQLQGTVNAIAQSVRDLADAQVGISTLTGTGSATVTI